jgi:3-oxoadipate enol-lactonase
VDDISIITDATFRAASETIVSFDARALLERIEAPTLVMAGSSDTNAPAATMERMAGKIPGARFVTIEGAGHLANLERPAAFNAILSHFVESIDLRRDA